MPDRKILDMDDLLNFELPPLPSKVQSIANEPEEAADVPMIADEVLDAALREYPEEPPEDLVQETVAEEYPDVELREYPEEPPEDQVAMVEEEISTDILRESPPVVLPDELVQAKMPDPNDFDFPPLREPQVKKEPVPDEELFIFEEKTVEKEDTVPDEEIFDFDHSYNMSLDQINTDNIVLEDMRRHASKNRRGITGTSILETKRMNELEASTAKPVLDEMSSEYLTPAKKAETLVEKEKLADDEKEILKRRLMEDLGKKSSAYNPNASKNLERKLMEEKKLKIAKKGFAISIIPIVLGIIGAAICFLTMNWGDFNWFTYVAIAAVVGALVLFIKSKQAKTIGIVLYILTMLAYVGPGLVMYALNETMQNEPDYIVHVVLAAVAAAANIVSVVILTKNEAVNTYYTARFSKK